MMAKNQRSILREGVVVRGAKCREGRRDGTLPRRNRAGAAMLASPRLPDGGPELVFRDRCLCTFRAMCLAGSRAYECSALPISARELNAWLTVHPLG